MATLFSPLANVTSISATADIEEDIAALAEPMHVLRSRRNALLPIYRLPTELLAMVFERFEEVNRFDGSASDDVPACLEITHVSRHWRKVALECPALWTFIRSSSPRWLGIMLERSKNAPLVVTYKSPVPLQTCLEPVLAQLSRIKVLQFPSLLLDVEHIIRLLSSQPAPLLEIFAFTKPWVYGDPTTRLISNTIFQGHAPRLRCVELTGLNLSWTAHIFSGLRTLCVRGTGTTSYPTLPQLLSTLRRMPALEHLTLEWLVIISEDKETKLLDKVPLIWLKSIALGSPSIQTATSLFAQLAIPVDAKIALQLTQIEGLQDFSDLFSAMDMHPDGSSSVVRSLHAIYISSRSLCVQFSPSVTMNPADSWNPRDDDTRLSIQFTYNVSAEVEPSIIFDICRFVTQDRIQKLSLSGFELPDRDFWRAGSACLPELEVIHVKSIAVGGLIGALEIIEGSQISNMLYPSLRVLELEEVDFMPDSGGTEELDEMFQDLMEMRAKHGVRIHTLRLAECAGLGADKVQGFRDVVATVDWDEYEEPLEDDSSDSSGDYDENWTNWISRF